MKLALPTVQVGMKNDAARKLRILNLAELGTKGRAALFAA